MFDKLGRILGGSAIFLRRRFADLARGARWVGGRERIGRAEVLIQRPHPQPFSRGEKGAMPKK